MSKTNETTKGSRGIYIEDELWELVEIASEDERRSCSNWICLAIQEKLTREKRRKASR